MSRKISAPLRAKKETPAMQLESLEARRLLAATKIMPLGDSITEGYGGQTSYRQPLWHMLAEAGYSVDFIGGSTGINGGLPPVNDYDENHEGHSGYRADQIRDNIIAWANANKPEVVLLHIGTNDILQSQTNASTATEIGTTIDRLRTVVPNVKILLAQIIPISGNSNVTDLNSRIATLVTQKNTAASPVILVDQYTGFDTANLPDGLHPNAAGDQVVASKWYSALTGILGTPTTPPPGSYLSDRSWTSMSNGWGNAERNRSNSETGDADGRIITLNGVQYMRGLGVHAGSDITYNIAGGGFTEFNADIGLDDEVGNNGSVVFQVYVDNVLKFTSAKLTGASTTQSITVPVTGGSTLRLVVNDSGDGNGFDHADWANARVFAGAPITPPTTPSGFSASYNSGANRVDLLWTDTSNNESGFRIERKLGTGGTWTALVPTLAANTQSASDTAALNPNATYYYRVFAFNSGGDSGPSNEFSVLTPAAPAQVYVSDLPFTVSNNGWGNPEKNKSNGENGDNDGKTITLNGVTYTKGIGVHATSDITVNLGGLYTQFLSDIGVDDEVGSNGSVVFRVYLDGAANPIYDSGTMSGTTATKQVNINVTGKSTLRLVVTDAGDGNGFDHADWANARLLSGAPTPAPTAPSGLSATYNAGTSKIDLLWTDASNNENGFRIERKVGAAGTWAALTPTLAVNTQSYSDAGPFAGSSTYFYRIVAFNGGGDSAPSNESSTVTPAGTIQSWLSDLTWASMNNGWGNVEKDQSNGELGTGDGSTLAIRSNTYAKGLGAHANSELVYSINGLYKTFNSDVGVDNETNGNGSVVFQVYLDGVLAYDSGLVTGTSAAKQLSLNVTGVQSLRLVVTDGGNDNAYDHADWGGAQLLG